MTCPFFCRWLLRQDHGEVIDIARLSGHPVLTGDDLIAIMRERHMIGLIAERNREMGPVLGFLIYRLHPRSYEITHLGVHPTARRQGIGQGIIQKMVRKLTHRRHAISAMVRESNLAGQLFLRSQGFRAAEIVRGMYDDSDEDGYLFRYRIADNVGNDYVANDTAVS